jgi:hypothetical protein
MNIKGLVIGETCTGTADTLTLTGSYALESGLDTIEIADAYADGSVIPMMLLASDGITRISGQFIFNSTAGTLTRNDFLNWNGTVRNEVFGSNITLPAGTHQILVGVDEYTLGFESFNDPGIGSTLGVICPDNVITMAGDTNTEASEAAYFSPAVYASPFAFNRIAIRIETAGAALSTIEAGIYRCADSTVFGSKSGLPGKLIAKATFDATVSGTQLVSVSPQILPPGRYWTALWTEDTTVTVKRSEQRSHSGAAGMWAFNNNGASALRITGQTELPSDVTAETFAARQSPRGFVVGLAYVP